MAGLLIKTWNVFSLTSSGIRYSAYRCLSCNAKTRTKRYSRHLLWSEVANSFGKLRISCGIELHVKAVNVWGNNDHVCAFILLNDPQEGLAESFKNIFKCTSYTDNGSPCTYIELNPNAKHMPKNYEPSMVDSSKLVVEVPHFYHLDINSTTSPNPVTVEKLEGDLRIQTMGDCTLSKLKSRLISVVTTQGCITGTSLVGDMVFTAGDVGQITMDKVQGSNIEINCEDGDVRIQSLYGGDVMVNSISGGIHIGDGHGNVHLNAANGNVTVGSISGLLRAMLKNGNIDAKITNGGNIDALVLNGNAVIKIGDNIGCCLDLSAQSINVSPDCVIYEKLEQHSDNLASVTGSLEGVDEQRVAVNCPNGELKLLKESWFVFPSS